MASNKSISYSDIVQAADDLGWDPAMVAAILDIECNWPRRKGFDKDGRLRILWERHKCWKYASPKQRKALPSWVCNRKPGGYLKSNKDRWKQLEIAKNVMGDKAYLCASYGLPQIMGFNYKKAGYSHVTDMVADFYKGEKNQLLAFVRFIKNNKRLWKAGKFKDFKTFAKLYNGRNYWKYRYDKKLADAYEKYSKYDWESVRSETRSDTAIIKGADKSKSFVVIHRNRGLLAMLVVMISALIMYVKEVYHAIMNWVNQLITWAGGLF